MHPHQKRSHYRGAKGKGTLITSIRTLIPSNRLLQIRNHSEDIRTRNAKLLSNCATAAPLSSKLCDAFAMHVNVPRPAEAHATSFRPRKTGVNAFTDDLVSELSYRAKNVHLKPGGRVRTRCVDTMLRQHKGDIVSRELSN